jgi:hypothetical protein
MLKSNQIQIRNSRHEQLYAGLRGTLCTYVGGQYNVHVGSPLHGDEGRDLDLAQRGLGLTVNGDGNWD